MTCQVCGRPLAGVVVMFSPVDDEHRALATCGCANCLSVAMHRAGRDVPAKAAP